MKEIYHCFMVNAPLEKVYRAVTEKSGLAGWWTKNLDVGNTVGSTSTFRFKSGAFNKMKIKNLMPNKVEWECTDGHKEWIGTKIMFELKSNDDKTKVCFSHYGWDRQTEYTGECSFHWAKYFISLQKFCETGKGIPDEGEQTGSI